MELKIKCDAKVSLKGLVNVVNVMCEVNEYKIDGNSLSGSVIIKGKYIKDDLHTQYDFSEVVPFTVVFKNEVKQIDKINVVDFSTNEVINTGIECKFDMYIEYQDNEKDDDGEVIAINSVNIDNMIEEEKIDEIEMTGKDDEKIKADINKKYDELLGEILESRDDNFLEEELQEDDVFLEAVDEKSISITNSKNETRPCFSNINDSYSSYRVYYPKEESELEKICNKEKISIDKIYKDKANKDFKDKKRIIIK